MKNLLKFFAIAAVAISLNACSGPAEKDNAESLNRAVFKFNEVVDAIVMKPVARSYRFVTPKPVRNRLSNVSSNLGEPVNMLNAFLQGDIQQGFTSFWRFLINSTVGIGGMNDVAKDAGLAHRSEDFGQTLAVWGVGEGDYVVLPIFGPSSSRDTIGLVVDALSNPFTYIPRDNTASIGIAAGRGVIKRESLLDPIDDVYATSLDPYATLRSIYLQRRDSEIRNSKPKTK
jgi:phospholipid-binding lipoprotein MlaA